MITIKNLNDALTLLLQNNDVFDRLKNDYPDVLADLVSLKNNPNCSCRNRVLKFFSDLLMSDPQALDKYVLDSVSFTTALELIDQQRQATNYSGRIFIIPKSEDSWKNFSKTLYGKVFRNFSIIERENEIAIYFL